MSALSTIRGVRRALTCDRPSRAVRSLIVTEDTFPAHSPEHVLVRVDVALVDPEPFLAGCTLTIPEAALIGTVQNDPVGSELHRGEVVTGVGPLADLVSLPPARLHALDAGRGLGTPPSALLPAFSALLSALEDAGIGLGTQVLVSGDGLTARLTRQLVEMSTGRSPQTVSTSCPPTDAPKVFDVVVDATADPAWWPQILPLARDEGRILLLLPPWPLVCPFDFYPDIHRRSLSLLTRMVPSTDGRSGSSNAGRILQDFVDRGLMSFDGLLSEVDVPSHGSSGAPIHLDASEGRGILVRWSDGAI